MTAGTIGEAPALLLGFTIPDSVAQPIFAADPLPAVQTHNFAWSLARALNQSHEQIYLLSAVPVQSYPIVPRKWFSASSFVEKGIEGRTIAFVNFTILKHLTRFLSCLAALPQIRRWRVRSVYIHGSHSPFLLFGALLALLGYRVIPVLTDPPGVILPTDGKVTALCKRLDRSIIRKLVLRSTAIVALAPELARPYEDKLPVLLMPGILNGSWIERVRTFCETDDKHRLNGRPIVLYAGGLAAAYGIDRLIEAAWLLPEVDFVFYGKGDQEANLANCTAPNIYYRGFADAAQLAEAMSKASVLINPRPSHADFAVQSFPSKLIEYLATGRTVLTTRILSIPTNLADYFEYIDNETPTGIADAIQRVLSRPRSIANAVAHIEALYGEQAVGAKLAELARHRALRDSSF